MGACFFAAVLSSRPFLRLKPSAMRKSACRFPSAICAGGNSYFAAYSFSFSGNSAISASRAAFVLNAAENVRLFLPRAILRQNMTIYYRKLPVKGWSELWGAL